MTIEEQVRKARTASRLLASLSRARKDEALELIAEALRRRAGEILAENAEDVALARANKLSAALVDRLYLDEDRLKETATSIRELAALPDPVGEIEDGRRLPNGIELTRVRVPLGVVAVVYEARPNVTVDAAGICLKSGNAVVLRGGSAAKHSNRMLAEVVQGAVLEAGLPAEAVTFIAGPREALLELVALKGLIDVVIPRGGEELKELLAEHSRVPVIAAAGGNCHVYVDAAADLDMALAITVNAKCQRPGVCNAAETLLVHRDVAARVPAASWWPSSRGAASSWSSTGPRPSSCPTSPSSAPTARTTRPSSSTSRWRYAWSSRSTRPSTTSPRSAAATPRRSSPPTSSAATRFTREVDAAAVYVNASTRFTDGGQFGLGAEMGISTQKLHVRGPISLRELTCLKYVAWGDGQVRT